MYMYYDHCVLAFIHFQLRHLDRFLLATLHKHLHVHVQHEPPPIALAQPTGSPATHARGPSLAPPCIFVSLVIVMHVLYVTPYSPN